MKTVAVVDRDIAQAIFKRAPPTDWHSGSLSFDQLFSFAKMQAVDQGNSASGIQLLATVKMVFGEQGAPNKLYGIAVTFPSLNTFVVSDREHESDVIDALIEDAKQNGTSPTFVVAVDNQRSIKLLQGKGFADPGSLESPEASYYNMEVYTMVKVPIFYSAPLPNSAKKFPPDVDTEGRV